VQNWIRTVDCSLPPLTSGGSRGGVRSEFASSWGRGKSDAGATQKNSRDGRHVRGLWGSRHETSILFVQNGEELRRRVPGESLGGPQGLRQGAGQRQRAGRGSLSLRRRKARSRRCPCSCRWA